MNTHETYVSLETAKLLKEASFDWECNKAYYDRIYNIRFYNDEYINDVFAIPTLSIAQKWLREVKNVYMYVDIYCNEKNPYFYTFGFSVIKDGKTYPYATYSTYEGAQEAGIKKALEMILEKGE